MKRRTEVWAKTELKTVTETLITTNSWLELGDPREEFIFEYDRTLFSLKANNNGCQSRTDSIVEEFSDGIIYLAYLTNDT
jgi:hypothetical protein